MSFPQIVIENARLIILQALEEDPDYSHNEDILRGVLEAFGHRLSHDRLRTELHWLAEQGLVGLEQVRDLLVVRLTPRGEDVALGNTRVPGVARPRPGA
ncbi:MAG: hypothetical protein D6717_06780 [Gammaproteobacteria bacterium]|nr:MAG: hypothetical protein D6717_06780 [Gammaproteobacteria bacterium]